MIAIACFYKLDHTILPNSDALSRINKQNSLVCDAPDWRLLLNFNKTFFPLEVFSCHPEKCSTIWSMGVIFGFVFTPCVNLFNSLSTSVDIASGERLWTLDISGTETPWVSGDWVFTLSTNLELIGISRNAGNIKWVTQLEQYLDEEEREGAIRWSGPILVSGKLLIISSHGIAAWLSPQTGEIIETSKIPGSFYIAPIIVDEVIYLLSDDGALIAYN